MTVASVMVRLLPAAVTLALSPWLAAGLFGALIGASQYQPGYADYPALWQLYAVTPRYRVLLLIAAAIPLLSAAALAVLPFRHRRPTLFGDAHFADESEIRRAGLRANTGIILGRFHGRLLRAAGQIGVLVFAPPRSGKGVGFVIPNLLTWPGSALVNDIKLANFEATSGCRAAMGQQVYLFAPLDAEGRTHNYNPLDFVSKRRDRRINDIQAITSKLVVTPQRADPMWSTEARMLLDALILFLLDVNGRASLGAVYRTVLATPDFNDYLRWALRKHTDRLDPFTVMQFNGFLSKAGKEQSGVLSSLQTALSLFSNPYIDRATSSSDFDLRELRRTPTTVYLGVMPRDIARLAPLLNIFVQQAFDGLLGHLPGPDEPHALLALLDEFTALGRLENVEKGIGYFASYNIVLAPVIQDLSQLEETYGHASMETFLATANIRIAYAQNSLRTAKYLSDELGFRTVKTRTQSRPSHGRGSRSISESQSRRELMLPHEIREMPADEQLILVEASPPVKAKKIRYFRDRRFRSLVRPALQLPRSMTVIQEPPVRPKAVCRNLTDDEIARVVSLAGKQGSLEFEEPSQVSGPSARR